MTNFQEYLKEKEACDEAVKWITENDLTPQQTWDTCHRGDWLLWWKLANVPASYLLWMHKTFSHMRADLKEYIESNMEALKKESNE